MSYSNYYFITDDNKEYSYCFVNIQYESFSHEEFQSFVTKNLTKLEDGSINSIIENFGIKVNYDLVPEKTDILDLFNLDDYKKYYARKHISGIIVQGAEFLSMKIATDSVVYFTAPCGATLLMYCSPLKERSFEHYYLGILQESGILK